MTWVALGRARLRPRLRLRTRPGATGAPRSRQGQRGHAPAVALATGLLLCGLAACEPEQEERVRVPELQGLEGAAAGRLIAVAALADGGNQVWAVESESGVAQPLFTIDPSYSMSEWKVSLGGRDVMYRLSHPLKEVRERLVVQRLAAGAEPTEVASSGSDEARLAGAAWHEPGLVYGLQSGLGIEEGSDRAWSLMRWDGRRARSLWQMAPAPDSPRQLVGWDPEAAVATILDLPEQGGPARGLRYVLDGSEVGYAAISIPSSGAAASPDGTQAAVVDAEAGEVVLIAAVSGERTALDRGRKGRAEGPVWSGDGVALGWTETGDTGERWARVLDVGGGPREVRSMALPPDARVVAVARDAMAAVSADGMAVHVWREGDDEWRRVPWEPPGSVWRVDWTPPAE